jgi:haloacetate dehalogenase
MASTTWHRVAPRLHSSSFFVVCPDLRGYGQSTLPPQMGEEAPDELAVALPDVDGGRPTVAWRRVRMLSCGPGR